MHAAWCGQETVVALLLKCGAQVREKDRWNRTAWILARRKGHRGVVSLIEEEFRKDYKRN